MKRQTLSTASLAVFLVAIFGPIGEARASDAIQPSDHAWTDACGDKGQNLKSRIEHCTKIILATSMPVERRRIAFVQRARAHVTAGTYENALSDLNEAARLKYDGADLLEYRGYLCRVMRRHDCAVSDFTVLLKRDPNNSDFLLARGQSFSALGMQDKALIDLNRMLTLAPNSVEGRVTRASLLDFNGESDKALADVNLAIKLSPNNPRAYFTRGLMQSRTGIHLETKDYKQAIADFTRALDLEPKMYLVREVRAQARHKLAEEKRHEWGAWIRASSTSDANGKGSNASKKIESLKLEIDRLERQASHDLKAYIKKLEAVHDFDAAKGPVPTAQIETWGRLKIMLGEVGNDDVEKIAHITDALAESNLPVDLRVGALKLRASLHKAEDQLLKVADLMDAIDIIKANTNGIGLTFWEEIRRKQFELGSGALERLQLNLANLLSARQEYREANQVYTWIIRHSSALKAEALEHRSRNLKSLGDAKGAHLDADQAKRLRDKQVP